MKLRLCLHAFIILLLSAGSALAGFASPDATIKALYASYGLGSESGKDGFDDKLAAQAFDSSLFKLYQRAAKSDGIDYDFFVQGNDFSLVKPIEISAVKIDENHATVSAILTENLVGDKEPVKHFTFKLLKTRGGWQIDTALYDGKSVRDAWAAATKSGD